MRSVEDAQVRRHATPTVDLLDQLLESGQRDVLRERRFRVRALAHRVFERADDSEPAAVTLQLDALAKRIGILPNRPSCGLAEQDHFGRALRIELAGSGVACSTVFPVQTTTEFSVRTTAESAGKAIMTGSGRKSQTPETVAAAIVRCLRKPKGEVWTSRTTRLAFALATAWPGLADRAIAREWKKRREHKESVERRRETWAEAYHPGSTATPDPPAE